MAQKKKMHSIPAWIIDGHIKRLNDWMSPSVRIPLKFAFTDRAAEYLPDGWTSESSGRVRTLFNLSVQAVGTMAQEPQNDAPINELNELLQSYPTTPYLVTTAGGIVLSSLARGVAYPPGESSAVQSLLQLIQIGNISEFAMCPGCRQAFTPRTAKQQFCSTRCYRDDYSKRPEEIARRRAAAAAHYESGKKLLAKKSPPKRAKI